VGNPARAGRTRRARTRRAFGMIRRLPSGRWQVNFTGPDLRIHKAPRTFDTRMDGEGWLAGQRRAIDLGTWVPPGAVRAAPARPGGFEEYAAEWLEHRDLKPRTRELYRSLLDRRLLPTFGPMPLDAISPAVVRKWFAEQAKDKTPTARSHAYGLLRTVLGTAVSDELLQLNPCHIRGAGAAKRVKEIRPATLPELAALVDAMPARVSVRWWCSRAGPV
jgi:hypothetical protein